MLASVTREEVIASGLISLADLTGEESTIPTGKVGYRCGMSPGEAKGIKTRGSLDLLG